MFYIKRLEESLKEAEQYLLVADRLAGQTSVGPELRQVLQQIRMTKVKLSSINRNLTRILEVRESEIVNEVVSDKLRKDLDRLRKQQRQQLLHQQGFVRRI